MYTRYTGLDVAHTDARAFQRSLTGSVIESIKIVIKIDETVAQPRVRYGEMFRNVFYASIVSLLL